MSYPKTRPKSSGGGELHFSLQEEEEEDKMEMRKSFAKEDVDKQDRERLDKRQAKRGLSRTYRLLGQSFFAVLGHVRRGGDSAKVGLLLKDLFPQSLNFLDFRGTASVFGAPKHQKSVSFLTCWY